MHATLAAVDYAGSYSWRAPSYIALPILLLVAGIAVAAGYLAVVVVRAAFRRRREFLGRCRANAGLCVACGYDLRAAADRCPECGAPVGKTTEART